MDSETVDLSSFDNWLWHEMEEEIAAQQAQQQAELADFDAYLWSTIIADTTEQA